MSEIECRHVDGMMEMQSSGFETTAWQLIVALRLFMGAIEYVLRVALKQPGKGDFFPISLVASGVSLNIALTMLPGELRQSPVLRSPMRRVRIAIIIESAMGIFGLLCIFNRIEPAHSAASALRLLRTGCIEGSLWRTR